MRRAALLAMLASACASAPEPKLAWNSTIAPPGADDEAAGARVSDDELAARTRLGPLAVSTFRFGGVERVLRDENPGHFMPGDARLAWSGLFAAIDQSLAGDLPATRGDLVRARVVAVGEFALDAKTYAELPEGLEAAVDARLRAISTKLASGKLARASPTDELLAWPVHPVNVTSLFGPRLDPIDGQTWKRHEGLDLAADKGELVTAAASGTVVESARREGYGLLVAIRHADGTITRYGHLSQLLTHEGLTIERGGAVGLAGATGRATGPHVHFEVWRHGRAVDPIEELEDPDPVAGNVVSRAF